MIENIEIIIKIRENIEMQWKTKIENAKKNKNIKRTEENRGKQRILEDLNYKIYVFREDC